mgnify:CR=1 FL=1
MAFKIVIVQVKARNTIVCITVFTLFNDILFNCLPTYFFYKLPISEKIHPFSNFCFIEMWICIGEVVHPCWIFDNSHPITSSSLDKRHNHIVEPLRPISVEVSHLEPIGLILDADIIQLNEYLGRFDVVATIPLERRAQR